MFFRLPCTVARALLAALALSGCAGQEHDPARQTSMVPPEVSERSDPGGTAVVAALDALALGYETFGPPQDQHSQPPTDEAFRQAAGNTGGNPDKK